jgi:hypothetical protein
MRLWKVQTVCQILNHQFKFHLDELLEARDGEAINIEVAENVQCAHKVCDPAQTYQQLRTDQSFSFAHEEKM